MSFRRGKAKHVSNEEWDQQPLKIQSLHFDALNPRLGQDRRKLTPREIIGYLFDTENAIEVAKSIATRGYFQNEPLLVVVEGGDYVVVEGNRRLAALKTLVDPELVDAPHRSKMEKISASWKASRPLTFVPCVVAPSRRDANRVVAGRHQSNAVVAWSAEDRAQFILDRLEDGYTIEELESELGFEAKDVQKARQRRAIVAMVRALDLPADVRARVEGPRAQMFSTIERVFDSSVGRQYLMVEPDPDHGLRGTTTASEFKKGLKKLVVDVADPNGKWDSRSLNTKDDIGKYFEKWKPSELPRKRNGQFTPDDITADAPSPTPAPPVQPAKRKRVTKKPIIPIRFMIEYCGSDRVREIHEELTRMKGSDFPNGGSVLLRVFTEIAITDYLERQGAYDTLVKSLKASGKLPYYGPTFGQRVKEVLKIAKRELTGSDYDLVSKAFSSDKSAPFTLNELHSFVHSPRDLPSERDMEVFWSRAEPLFKMMLQEQTTTDEDSK